jgi:hypothetical protein
LAAGGFFVFNRRSRHGQSEPFEQLCGPDTQGVSDYFQSPKGHALAAGLEAVEVRSIQTGEFRKLILGDALLLSEFLDVPADPEIDVLRCPRVESYAAPLHPA